MKIKLSDLRHPIRIVQPGSSGSYGASPGADIVVADDLRASIKQLKSWEKLQRHQIKSEATHTIIFRFVSGIKSGMIIESGSLKYKIDGDPENDDDQNKWLIAKAVKQ